VFPDGIAADRSGWGVLFVVTGPIASGKSTLARAVVCEFRVRGVKAAAVDLDLVYEMLDPSGAPKIDRATWAQTRRTAARLAVALFTEVVVVVVEGEFLTAAQRAEFADALPSGIEPQFVMLRVPYDVAEQRVLSDPFRGRSRDPVFLRDHFNATQEAVRNAPATDLALDTSAVGVAEAVGVIVDWASSLEA
jgi:adenylylsulfate kinase-like enzyme